MHLNKKVRCLVLDNIQVKFAKLLENLEEIKVSLIMKVSGILL